MMRTPPPNPSFPTSPSPQYPPQPGAPFPPRAASYYVQPVAPFAPQAPNHSWQAPAYYSTPQVPLYYTQHVLSQPSASGAQTVAAATFVTRTHIVLPQPSASGAQTFAAAPVSVQPSAARSTAFAQHPTSQQHSCVPVMQTPSKPNAAAGAAQSAPTNPGAGVPVVGVPIDPVDWRRRNGIAVIDTKQTGVTVDFIIQLEDKRCCLFDAGVEARCYVNGVSNWRFCTKQLAGANPHYDFWYPRLWSSKIDSFLDAHWYANMWVWSVVFAATMVGGDGTFSCCLFIKKIVFIIIFLVFMSFLGILIAIVQTFALLAYFAALVCHIRNRCAYSDPGSCIDNEELLQVVNNEFNESSINQWVGFSVERRRLLLRGRFTLSFEEEQRLLEFDQQRRSTVEVTMTAEARVEQDNETFAVLVVGDRFMSLYKWAIVKGMFFMVLVYAWTIFILVMAMKYFGR